MLFTLFTMLNHHGKNANKPPAIAAEEGTRGCNKGCKKKSILSDRFFCTDEANSSLEIIIKIFGTLDCFDNLTAYSQTTRERNVEYYTFWV